MSDAETPNLAVFCDFENLALGVRDARYDAFDIDLALARVLDKGKIVAKRAYADWERYKSHKRGLHEAAFELIEIPHVSYSGKNSADIRLVVDALDLCYTKDHVDGFVIMSGDSDFSPLVSKLRENNKLVVGLGVKNSSSHLLIDNCDEFIYYDDLVRGRKARGQKAQRRSSSGAKAKPGGERAASDKADKADKGDKADKASAEASKSGGDKAEARELVLETCESIFQDRDGNVYGSMIKQVLKRKRPNFNESYYGYRTFNQLLEDARDQQLLEIQRDDKSGGYLILGFGPKA
ncbi:MAG: NYN domain-containing protein [Myxococcales bacterium]|nr:NYN domain-containing protein [Myxococcales bacterium]